ncbi:hypothetical protein NTGBS_220005 [Candidatus Nitrotoga sp. BS]|nr:hypothetical protein NTGBS_220005 [Candidatus Nitrotoga sp. BS]
MACLVSMDSGQSNNLGLAWGNNDDPDEGGQEA